MKAQDAKNEVIVIALGGNAIKKAEEKGTVEEQFQNVKSACKPISELIKSGYQVVITHGNGPQAGALLIQQEEGLRQDVPAQPLDVCGSMTQGQIGFMLQQTLMNYIREVGLSVPVLACVTQVQIDPNDQDFQKEGGYSKPVGPFYTKEEAETLRTDKNYVIKQVRPTGDRIYRRVVPSPDPIAIVEERALKLLVATGAIVIASGGGGIPVMEKNGYLEGVEAVIDKDKAGEKLAEAVGAQIFLIITDIDKVKLNYGTPNETAIDEMSVAEAEKYLKEGHFLPGSMEPKIEAAVRFIKYGGKRAIITSLVDAVEALEGRAGTTISLS